MSKKKKKNVQNAEAKTQTSEKDSSPQAVPKEQPQEATAPAMPFDLSKMDPKKIALAEEMGIPIKQLIGWAASVELRFAAIQKNLEDAPQKVVEALKAEALKRQTEVAQKMQQQGINPQQGGSGEQSIVPLLLKILAGGGGGSEMDEEMKNLSKDLLKAQITRIKTDIGFSDAIKNAIVTKIAAKATTDILG